MRIALFSGNYNYLREGANQALNILVGYLEQAGHQVRVYSPVTRNPDFEPTGTLVPVPSIRLPVRGEFRLALGIAKTIRRDLDRFSPDIVHVATPDILGTRAQSYAIAAGIPIVVSLHTHFEAYLPYYRLDWLKPAADAHLRRFYRRANHVLVPTPALAVDMREMRGDDHVSVWSRGVDRSLFRPSRRDQAWRRSIGIGDEEVTILFFGRVVMEKGVEIFARVIEMLQDRGTPVRPLVVGAGPAIDRLTRLPGVVATGHLQREALARAVASADLMLTPSTTETFGNVVLEAMASGLAVVSADAPSARSLLTTGATGILCPPHAVEAYVTAITMLAGSSELSQEMGAAAAAESERYSWAAASASVENAYRTLVKDRREGKRVAR